jgi:hypothetical protein
LELLDEIPVNVFVPTHQFTDYRSCCSEVVSRSEPTEAVVQLLFSDLRGEEVD